MAGVPTTETATGAERDADVVPGDDVPGFDGVPAEPIKAIGAEIRRLRGERGLSLRELSARTGLSTGFLSLVERGRSMLALTSLYTVATALDTEVAHFFPPRRAEERSHPLPHVSRAGDGVGTVITTTSRVYRMLSPRTPDKVLEPLFVTIQPTDADAEPYGHDGEEFCHVLKGELVYVMEGREHRLGPGDSIHIESSVPHAIRNDTGEPVEALWVLTPPLLR